MKRIYDKLENPHQSKKQTHVLMMVIGNLHVLENKQHEETR